MLQVRAREPALWQELCARSANPALRFLPMAPTADLVTLPERLLPEPFVEAARVARANTAPVFIDLDPTRSYPAVAAEGEPKYVVKAATQQ